MAAAASVHQLYYSTVASQSACPKSTLVTPSLLSKKLKLSPTNCNPLTIRALSAGVPSEELDNDEDSKFVPLNPDDPKYGPPALLLVGFKPQEAEPMQQLLKELEGEFLRVIFCREDMITRSLWDAVNEDDSASKSESRKSKIAESEARICFLSGLTGEEMMMFIDAYDQSGFEPAVFAALVPNSADKPVKDLIQEIMGDHEMVTKQRQSESRGA